MSRPDFGFYSVKKSTFFRDYKKYDSLVKILNDTVSETHEIVQEVHSNELMHIDEKLTENEESLLRMNSSIEDTVGRIEDITLHINGLANSLDRFRTDDNRSLKKFYWPVSRPGAYSI